MSATSDFENLPADIRALAVQALRTPNEIEIIGQINNALRAQPEMAQSLASFILFHISSVVDNLPASTSVSALEATELWNKLSSGLVVIRNLGNIFPYPGVGPPSHIALGPALFGAGLVPLLCKALSYVADGASQPASDTEVPGPIVSMILALLCGALHAPLVFPRALEAISNGLLQSLIALAAQEVYDAAALPLFKAIFNQSLFRVRVLDAVNQVFPELQALASAAGSRFRDRESAIFPLWESFETMTSQRVRLYEEYTAGKFPAMKMCANVNCSLIAKDTDFQRCSGCHLADYCSAECQKEDWRIGGHKRGCALLRSIPEAEVYKLDLTAEDRDFLRVVMDADLETVRLEVLTRTVKLVAEPGAPEPLVYFSYYAPDTKGDSTYTSAVARRRQAVSLSVTSAESSGGLKDELMHILGGAGTGDAGKAAWAEMVRRAKASGGRMMLDCAMFAGGPGARPAVILVPRYVTQPFMPRVREMGRVLGEMSTDGSAAASAAALEFLRFGDKYSEFH